jgi:hypothetical protein
VSFCGVCPKTDWEPEPTVSSAVTAPVASLRRETFLAIVEISVLHGEAKQASGRQKIQRIGDQDIILFNRCQAAGRSVNHINLRTKRRQTGNRNPILIDPFEANSRAAQRFEGGLGRSAVTSRRNNGCPDARPQRAASTLIPTRGVSTFGNRRTRLVAASPPARVLHAIHRRDTLLPYASRWSPAEPQV